MIQPIQRLTVAEKIVQQMKELILSGELNPGDKLSPERGLIEQFGVGRTSLREVMKVLESQGLIYRTQQGTFITTEMHNVFSNHLTYKLFLATAEADEIFESRYFLEKELTQLAAIRRSKEDLEKISLTIIDMRKAIDHKENDKFIDADMAFHDRIAQATKNRIMHDIFSSISDLVFRIQRKVIIVEGVAKKSLQFHEKIYQAITDQNPELSSQVMLEHLDSVKYYFNKGQE